LPITDPASGCPQNLHAMRFLMVFQPLDESPVLLEFRAELASPNRHTALIVDKSKTSVIRFVVWPCQK
jgi:hypothetical protein